MEAKKRFGRRAAHRDFVQLAAASALAVPAWIRIAFAENACPPGRPKAPGTFTSDLRWDQLVTGAFGRAAAAGKPVLVLVATRRDWHRAEAFGELLNHGSDEALAVLGVCEVVCAPLAAVNRLVPRMPQSAHEPLMVLIETNALPARATALDVPLPNVRDVDLKTKDANRRWREAYEEKEKKIDERVSERIRVLHRPRRSPRRDPD